MIIIKGESIKDIYYQLNKKFIRDNDNVKATSNGYVVTLPKEAKGMNILIKFEE